MIELKGESDKYRIVVGDLNITLSDVKNKQTNLLRIYTCTIQLRNLYPFLASDLMVFTLSEIILYIVPIKSFGGGEKRGWTVGGRGEREVEREIWRGVPGKHQREHGMTDVPC